MNYINVVIYPTELSIIIGNVILSNEFTDAKHFAQGIQNYPMELFKNSSGEFNTPLFIATMEILSYHAEYKGLLAEYRKKPSKFLESYLLGIRQLANQMYGILSSLPLIKNMDMKFIKNLQNDFNPEVLFKPL